MAADSQAADPQCCPPSFSLNSKRRPGDCNTDKSNGKKH
jgi:hypothetical protein